MKTFRILTAALCVTLTGCFSPHTVATRHFVLASVPATDSGAANNVRLGVRVVSLPSYLLGSSLAVRKNANEISYLETALWAERIDHGFERVLAADLSARVPTEQVRLSVWRAEDVTVEVHVTVEQFDVDEAGKGTLVAWWRIAAPGGNKVLKSGESRLTKQGASPSANPQNIVTTLSEMTAEFSGILAQGIREAAPQ